MRRSVVLLTATLMALGTVGVHPGVAYADEAPTAEVAQSEAGLAASEPETVVEAPPAPAPAAEVPAAVEPVTEVPAPPIVAEVVPAVPAAEPVPAAPDGVAVEAEVATPAPAPGPVAKPLTPTTPRRMAAKLVAVSGGVDERYITSGETSTFAGMVPAASAFAAYLALFDNAECAGDPITQAQGAMTGSPTFYVAHSAVLTTPGTYYWQMLYYSFGGAVETTDCGALGSVVTAVPAAEVEITSSPDDQVAEEGNEATFEARFTSAPAATAVGWEALNAQDEWVPFTEGAQELTGNVFDGFVSTLTVPGAADLDGLTVRLAVDYFHTVNEAEITFQEATTAYSNSAELTVEVPVAVVTEDLPDATVGQPYEEQLEAEGGLEDYTWSLPAGVELPAGLELDEDGFVFGTPTEAGEFNIEVAVSDPSLAPIVRDSVRSGSRLSLALPSPPVVLGGVHLSVLPAAVIIPVSAGQVASAPLNVKATQTGPGQVTITWDPPASAGSSPITGYSVGYGNGGSGNGGVFGPNVRSAVFDGLSAGEDYQASVTAITAAGDGARAQAPFTILATFTAARGVGGGLPFTGTNSSDTMLLSGWLLLAGLALTAGSKIRRRPRLALRAA